MNTCNVLGNNKYCTRSQLTSYLKRSTYNTSTCNKGITRDAYNYITEAGGITLDNLYPYEPRASKCNGVKEKPPVTVTNWYRVCGERAMIDYVLSGGTLSAVIDSTQMGSYKSGVFSSCTSPNTLDHTVNIVGVNVADQYWIIRNSWGTSWGENGYMKLALVCAPHIYISDELRRHDRVDANT